MQDLFKEGEEKYLVVLNYDSLVVFKELYKKIDKNNIVLIANISNTPWIVKQIAVNGELEKMYKESKIPLINDSDGAFINTLAQRDTNRINTLFINYLQMEKLKKSLKEM